MVSCIILELFRKRLYIMQDKVRKPISTISVGKEYTGNEYYLYIRHCSYSFLKEGETQVSFGNSNKTTISLHSAEEILYTQNLIFVDVVTVNESGDITLPDSLCTYYTAEQSQNIFPLHRNTCFVFNLKR